MYPRLGNCLFSRHYITSTPLFQFICTLSRTTEYSPDITSPLSLHSNLYEPPLGYLLSLKILYPLYPSIPIYMYPSSVNVYSQDIMSSDHSIPIYAYPLLGKCLFYRHYITSAPPFKSIGTSSWVNVFS